MPCRILLLSLFLLVLIVTFIDVKFILLAYHLLCFHIFPFTVNSTGGERHKRLVHFQQEVIEITVSSDTHFLMYKCRLITSEIAKFI